MKKLNCDQLVELITDYLEDMLPRRQRRKFERHLDECKGCTKYLSQMRETIRLTSTLKADDIAPEAMDDLLKAFKASRAAN